MVGPLESAVRGGGRNRHGGEPGRTGVLPQLAPVPGVPVLRLGPGSDGVISLLIADLHLGLGASADRPAGPPEASAPVLAQRLAETARTSQARRVVIAGDVKHPIVGTPPALRAAVFDFFAALLSEGIAVEVVLGNHDVGLTRHLPKEVLVHPATGVVLDQVGIFHGHCWPSNRVLRAPRLVVGHLHPGFRLAPSPDDPLGKRRCWVRVELPPPAQRTRRRRRHAEVRASELIVLPAFNPIAGTEALNREHPARGRSFLYGRFLSRGIARAYLFDGTDLGVLTLPRPTVRSRAASAAPRGR
ncbi:MAG: metallophosphoesterase [Thermoplasmata archaeon]|nr:metallophosphoesterase [Thermoplasmata archaeon]